MEAAITSVYAVITPWAAVTLVSRSSTRALMDTFMTVVSTVMRNWVTARSGSTAPPTRAVRRARPFRAAARG